MANKAVKRSSELGKLTRTVERGFAAVADEFDEIKKTMATKDDIAAIRKEMATKADIAGINRRLDQIIQIQLDQHASRIKKLETTVFK